ncbi:SLC13 family permease [Streptomyces sp. NBC_01244]|uniref:SLC13 family permease n=1 Tax=Streptomyces sp. NBC_01244 TaxID=2903797 RepID=UPI002E0D19BA|nr:SLC13 family permease [Streptomyces sp. NBC_01244]
MNDSTLCLLVLAAVIALFVWNRLPVEIVALGSALLVYAVGLISVDEVFAGFGDPVVVYVASLFVVGAALQASGLTAWAEQELAARAGTGERRLLAVTMLLASAIAALISVTGAVAALLPSVVMVAVRLGLPPSKLAMPLAYASHAGSLVVLTGNPINVLVSEGAEDSGGRPFRFFEFAAVGIPLVAGTVTIAVVFGSRLLPRRTPSTMPADLSRHARTLIGHYGLEEDAIGLQVPPLSPLIGTPADHLPALVTPGVSVVGVLSAEADELLGDAPVRHADTILVRGEHELVKRFADRYRLLPLPGLVDHRLSRALINQERGMTEIVISPRSGLAGETVFPGMTSADGELVVLAVQRRGHDIGPGPGVLAAGDTLLLHGPWHALSRTTRRTADLLVVDAPSALRRHVLPLGPRAWRALSVLLAMVVLLATGVVPAAVAVLLAAIAFVLLKVLSTTTAYDSVSWTTVIIVGGMFPLSIAVKESGAADDIAGFVVSAAGGNGYLLLLGVFLLTAALGQFISNMATAMIIIPVAVSAAQNIGVSVQPVLMTVAVAAAASLLTPVATPANLMVMAPGGYRFGDYWKLGLPVMAWFLAVTLLIVPVVWPL